MAKTLGKIGIFLGALVLWAAAMELGCYMYLRFVPSRYNHLSWYLEGMVKNFHPLFKPEGASAAPKYYPYVGFYREGRWDTTPSPVPRYPDGWLLPLGAGPDGRERFASPEKPKGRIRVIAIGGSTMAGMGQSSEETSIAGRLQSLLRQSNPGKDIEVLNAAFYTYIAAEEMVLLSTKLIAFDPDLVVAMDGYNEFIKAYYFPDLPPFWGQHQEYLYRTFDRTQTFKGTLAQLGFLLSKRFYSLAIPRVILFARRTHPKPAVPSTGGGGPPPAIDPAPYRRAIDEYLAMHRNMIGVAHGQGFPIVAAFQPNITHRKPLSEAERGVIREWNAAKPRYSEAAAVYYPEADRGYDRLAAEERGKARKPPVTVLNLSGLFEKTGETLYVDSCHYNDRGAELIARALAPAAARALGLKTP